MWVAQGLGTGQSRTRTPRCTPHPNRHPQTIALQCSGGSFKPKDCKFKVQQEVPGHKGSSASYKTVSKTASLDLAQYCTDAVREQRVTTPLT